MKKKTVIIGIVTLIVLVSLSGCQEFPEEIFEEITIVKFTVEPPNFHKWK